MEAIFEDVILRGIFYLSGLLKKLDEAVELEKITEIQRDNLKLLIVHSGYMPNRKSDEIAFAKIKKEVEEGVVEDEHIN